MSEFPDRQYEVTEAGYEELLEGVREAADWFNGYIGWLEHTGREVPDGANEVYKQLDDLVEKNGGW